MKYVLLVLFLASSISLNAQSTAMLYGNWEYEDLYEKEKIDAAGLKMLEHFFGGMTFSFDKDGHYKAEMMRKAEEGSWNFDTDSKKITLTSSRGSVDEMEVIEMSENRLVIKAGSGTFILGRQ